MAAVNDSGAWESAAIVKFLHQFNLSHRLTKINRNKIEISSKSVLAFKGVTPPDVRLITCPDTLNSIHQNHEIPLGNETHSL